MFELHSGLHILEDLLHNIDKDQVAQSFYQSYLLNLIEHMFSVITDSSHAGSMQTKFSLVIYPILFLCRLDSACNDTCSHDGCYCV